LRVVARGWGGLLVRMAFLRTRLHQHRTGECRPRRTQREQEPWGSPTTIPSLQAKGTRTIPALP